MKKKYLIIGVGILVLCSIFLVFNKTDKIQTISGDFDKMKGVKSPISCYCSDSGYLNSNGNKIPICFLDAVEIDCKKISLSGKFKTTDKVLNSPQNSCPNGEMKIFFVSSYECLD